MAQPGVAAIWKGKVDQGGEMGQGLRQVVVDAGEVFGDGGFHAAFLRAA